MKSIPSISNEINEDKIFEIINKNFSKLAPAYFSLVTNWLIRSYSEYRDIEKFIILVYLINKDLILFRKNGIIIDYDTFYKDKSLEIPKINISDISRDLLIPKESVRRKIEALEKERVIKKTGKKIFIERSGYITAQAKKTLEEFSILVSKFSEILASEKISNRAFNVSEISNSIKENFSFCWYHFYKFLFVFTNRWKTDTKTLDLETICIGLIVLINTVQNKNFKNKDFDREIFFKEVKKNNQVGMNAFSISDITGIPRATVVRKLEFLIENKFLDIDEKKLYSFSMNTKSKQFKIIKKLQDKNMISLSSFLYRVFNQINLISTN
ncbi:MarR family transcriptional regulator [uncultured Candidatus Pelagibacter sp.]|jgi:DNA-binding Lrp family transcriptional regulator|uniref:MarR family transcriptional regulator n=1 Tax=uncultured Candidatus Pelagibacter sp. TaxID=372654 RepID=UPI00263410B6|nr:MarR family transcriptional regulator [uncultured Candidatus Pelagibacter sp.]